MQVRRLSLEKSEWFEKRRRADRYDSSNTAEKGGNKDAITFWRRVVQNPKMGVEL